MKICILELDGTTPELIFNDERLGNIRRLMDLGLYGKLQDASLDSEDSSSIANVAICDPLTHASQRPILIGVRSDSSLPVNAIRVTCVATKSEPTEPASIHEELQQLFGDYAVGPKDPAALPEDRPLDEIVTTSGKQWEVARHLASKHEWDYFHFVETGLDRIPHGRVVPDYYLWLDEQVGSFMELLDSETIFLVISMPADSQDGVFLLAAPNCPLAGEYAGATLPDIAPTLLDLSGFSIPESIPGRSLVAGLEKRTPDAALAESDIEQLVQDRLAGLGYI
ncbi:MAG TPA: hypothetical protein VMG31_07290 [Verrucomicrobiae bacterium]|nr:hypothetical protein [Verrucomicrobiae bacterium]